MAFAKTDQFDSAIIEMAEFSAALSHPARIALLMHLLERGECRCTDLVDAMPLSQPSCSRHLAELRKANLVEATPHGNEVRYRIKTDRIQYFCNAFHGNLNPGD